MGEHCSKPGCNLPEDCGEISEFRHCAPFAKVGASSGDLPDYGFLLDGRLPEACSLSSPKLTNQRFAVVRTAASVGAGADWRRWYRLGAELGTCQSAIAYEAFAVSAEEQASGAQVPNPADAAEPRVSPSMLPPEPVMEGDIAAGDGQADKQAQRSQRVVAAKCFKNKGSVAFSQELKIMRWIGAHPHVLRLLEAFEGTEDDVLVLEYCKMGDVYEHYVRTRMILSEGHVAELMRQLLLGLAHLKQRRVEHRDVKPENLLLFEPTDACRVPLVKLADFGWATVVEDGKTMAIPPEGVGSLWYAAPELNPPAPGLQKHVPLGPLGSSDMWSVGVITYLLMIGHSPFNVALRIRDPAKRENEILRMAALGDINVECEPWHQRSSEAQKFCRVCIQPQARRRPPTEEALRHPLILAAPRSVKHVSRDESPDWPAKQTTWEGLDGFQRLGWQAIACAAAEPEMLDARVFGDLETLNAMCPPDRKGQPYTEALAMELAAAAVPAWFSHPKWLETMQLAFRYLDVGMDGQLDLEDLSQHVLGEDTTCVQAWIDRWRQEEDLDFACFRAALQYTAIWTEWAPGDGTPTYADVEVVNMLHSIDVDLGQGCSRFIDEFVPESPKALESGGVGGADPNAMMPL